MIIAILTLLLFVLVAWILDIQDSMNDTITSRVVDRKKFEENFDLPTSELVKIGALVFDKHRAKRRLVTKLFKFFVLCDLIIVFVLATVKIL